MDVIIIDDEARSRNALEILIKTYCPVLNLVASLENLPDGVKAINKFKPEIVFSDIEMPGYSGLELLDFFEKPNFEVIYTTAYSEYAIKAFELSAVGYLLKPVSPQLLMSTVERAIRMRGQSLITERLQLLRENFSEKAVSKLALYQSDGIVFVNLSDIIYLKADGYCTRFFLLNNKEILVTKNLKEYENILLGKHIFYRSHRSFIINLNHITAYQKSDGGIISLVNGHTADISREKKSEFEKMLNDNSSFVN